MKYKNLTKHEINICDSDGELVATIPPSGLEARISTESRLVDVSDGVEFYETSVLGDPYLQDEKGEKHTLPTLEVGTALIVSECFGVISTGLICISRGDCSETRKANLSVA